MTKKYERIKQDIREKILSEEYKVNEKLPTESELMEIYHVSRFTVRHAIDELEKENFIYRIQGGGIFVDDWKDKPKSVIKDKTIGLITTHIADYIFPNIITGIDNYISNYGYSILIANTQNNPKKERKSLTNLLSNKLSGLIIEPTKSALNNVNKSIYDNIKSMGIPMLFINAVYDDVDIPYLIMDDVRTGEMITNYLISLGHKQIVGIFKVDDKQGIHRMNGYIKAYQKHPEISNMGEIMMYQTEENKINLFKKLHTILTRSKFAPTAIVCYNDQLAIQVINFVKEIGLKIPEDLSIIGVDDYQFSKFINPRLTTIRHPQEKMGLDAGKMIIDMINKQPVTSKIYEPEMIKRDSVRPINHPKNSVSIKSLEENEIGKADGHSDR
ncbi:GntR family transcriptional regulator [Weizmannia acidilactici]|uniref:GntR family transcriptional regulator n=1 Tax=Weizmannia acidilactici TaxID=2607726 RepID=A0A5J4JM97_9BACI|nr:GntR family transcriptional regulator [Weizmannia acidilactici]GER67528.1 GntR family transcriptional regulator [Weizmannia acidilactici]GER71780.1 GntR family transcriptional regulator [Weizmannia acidilactici]GER75100.1 GntR family transcriptional regulator [Weizmannia acidilactici]